MNWELDHDSGPKMVLAFNSLDAETQQEAIQLLNPTLVQDLKPTFVPAFFDNLKGKLNGDLGKALQIGLPIMLRALKQYRLNQPKDFGKPPCFKDIAAPDSIERILKNQGDDTDYTILINESTGMLIYEVLNPTLQLSQQPM